MNNKNIIVTSGPTNERIDAVMKITLICLLVH